MVRVSRASGVAETPQRKWNNIPDLLRGMPVKVSVKDGKISNSTYLDEPNVEN